MTMEQGLEAIMGIIEGAEVKAPKVEEVIKETVYDGQGHVISVDGKKATTGYVKGAKRVKTPKDSIRQDLMDAVETLLSKSKAFEGKVGKNSTDGIVVRMEDADYCVKVAGHTKREFENREADFVAEKSYITRGKAVNHAPAIAKVIVAEFGNQNPCASFAGFEIEGLFTLLEAKAAGVKFEIQKPNMVAEFTFKITKKRARVVMS